MHFSFFAGIYLMTLASCLCMSQVNAVPIQMYDSDLVHEIDMRYTMTDISTNTSTYYCRSDFDCPINSACSGRINQTLGYCECTKAYDTLSGETFCGYARKKSLTPLLLDIFLDEFFPVGQVYMTSADTSTSSGRLAIAQIFTCGLVGYLIYLIVIGGIAQLVGGKEAFEVVKYFGYTFYSCMYVAWWIVNIVRNATCVVQDKNGVTGYF